MATAVDTLRLPRLWEIDDIVALVEANDPKPVRRVRNFNMTHYRKSLLDFLPRPGRQYRASLRQCDNFHGVAEHSRLKPGDSPRCRGRPIPTNQGKEDRTKIIAVAAKFLVLHGVRMTQDGLVVNYHCRVSPYLSVDEVHEHVDELDRKMRAAFTGIVRIVGHAEPLRT